MYRDTSSVDCAPRELTHACSKTTNHKISLKCLSITNKSCVISNP